MYKGRLTYEQHSNNYLTDSLRIIRSKAFHRLIRKSQVFFLVKNDHVRNRYSHSIEVATNSRLLALTVGLDPYLCEAIALSHDIGHAPLGHHGEWVIQQWLLNRGLNQEGLIFDHNLQGVRWLTHLEPTQEGYYGLNLSIQVLEGLLNHNKPALTQFGYTELANYFPYLNLADFNLEVTSREALLVSMVDDMTYIVHDILDAFRYGLVTLEQLLTLEPLKMVYYDLPMSLRADNEKAVVSMQQYLDQSFKNNLVQNGGVLSDHYQSYLAIIKSFLFKHVYAQDELEKHRDFEGKKIEFLLDFFVENPQAMNSYYYQLFNHHNQSIRYIVDYVAGMTDYFLQDTFDHHIRNYKRT